MASRGRIVFFSVLGCSAALGTLSYLRLQPRWKTATEAEIRAVIDPSLLVVDPLDPAELHRYERFGKVLGRISSKGGTVVPPSDTLLADLERLLDEGPLQPSIPDWAEMSFFSTNRNSGAVKAILARAKDEAAVGRMDRATKLVELALRVTYATEGRDTRIVEVIGRGSQESNIFNVTESLLPKLNDAQLTSLSQRIPPSPMKDEGLRRAVRYEFQGMLLQILPDPLAWGLKVEPRLDPVESLNILTRSNENRTEPLPGNYDAVETAKKVSEVAMISLTNTNRRAPQLDDSGEGKVMTWAAHLPVDMSPGAKEPWKRLTKLKYRADMAGVPNSYGLGFIVPLYQESLSFVKVSLRGRTRREAMRTQIALRRYRLKVGTEAPSLRRVVEAKLLPTLPIDFLDDGTLRYDAKRGRLWSVGKNGTDEGGKSTRPGNASEPDWAWNTRF